jgi:hypothetical protein
MVERVATAVIWIAIFLVVGAASSPAQNLVEGTEDLDFDRTEAWAMKYFASIALFTGFGVPPDVEAGDVVLGFEGGWIPSLSEEDRRVGFNGTKVEDLNKTSFFGRVRLMVGLPRNFSLTFGYTPPIEVGGVKPNLFALSVGHPFHLSERWRIGLRGFGQFGTIEGDITCDADTVAAGANPEGNPFRCEAVSNDEYKQRTIGGEATIGYTSANQKWTPYAGVSVNTFDLEFQVDAQYSGLTDRTLQLTDGVTYALTGGSGYAITPKLGITGEAFYSWLTVVRPPGTSSQNDGVFNMRFFVTYQLR